MRVLCTCVPGFGHFHPLVPLARALEQAGHEVAFATEERFCARVTRAGFRTFPAGLGPGKVAERTMALPGLGPPGPEDTWRFGAHMFAGVAAPAKIPALVSAIREWSAHLVVTDVTDFAGPVAAASTGVPWVTHSLGPMFPPEFHRLADELVTPFWAGPRPAAAYLDICPPSLQSPDLPALGAPVQPLRPVPFDAVEGEALPPWVDDLGNRPTVYVTLGTLDNDAPEVFRAVVEGLRDEPVDLIVTVGPSGDPDELGPQPGNVHVERYVPQSLLFPRCAAVVAHGGSGTTLAALAHGLPLLLLPQGANQFWNAERCAALGAAVRLVPHQVEPGAVRHAVSLLLDRRGYRDAARRVAAEIAAMPAPEEVVPLLERIAAPNG